ncbi:hypothetical protein [Paenibacillus lautus]|uniref:hypothetical protein n=1 Tax=Paenibacillus lautus TaxID=1401 RepID=UPI001BD112E2|nr:hypothetical protein [Paenibacillus lautus]
MNNWFVAECLMRQQQMEVDRTDRESWKYRHDPVNWWMRIFPKKRRQLQPVPKRTRSLN